MSTIHNYPRLEIDISKIFENTKAVVKRCKKMGIGVTAVTKCVGGISEVADAFINAGVVALGDSRIKNLKLLQNYSIPKWLIRIPMISEAQDVIKYSDVSLNSEIKVINSLNEEAKLLNKKHNIILMIDHGDLREGWINIDDFYEDCKKLKQFDFIEVIGIGTNSNCAGAIIPEPETFKSFPEIITFIKEEFNLNDPIVSGGNSGAYYMVENGTIPKFINNLRLGELLLFGNETSFQKQYDYLNQDVFNLVAEIIELKEKPSKPIGISGKDAFGKTPVFEDKGIQKRAILGIGKQDIPPEDLIPLDNKINVITASSDHLILDLTNCKKKYQVGDKINFNCTYGSGLRASTSDYVKKIIKH